MVRSMYSGVVGMKAQQTAMDTIGNNIANVKTYGYKASRTTFKDVYYQTLKSGNGATGNRGGTNPSQIGYGSQLGSIDVLHGQSSFSMTGRSLDMAIAGEGFFQVMDGDGNTFFTRAGQLLFDPAGNLVDSNGNFVLGVSGDPLGRAGGSEKIQVAIPPVDPNSSSIVETINSKKLTVKTSKNSEAGNISLTFQEDATLPSGQDVKAIITGGGTGITINVNPTAEFANMAAFQTAINKAITEANGGKQHPAGDFTFEFDPANAFTNIKGSEIVSKDYSVIPGKFTGTWPTNIFGGMKQVGTSSDFVGSGTIGGMTAKKVAGTGGAGDKWEIEMTMGAPAVVYKGSIPASATNSGEFLLTGPAGDTMTMTHPGFKALDDLDAADAAAGDGTLQDVPDFATNVVTVAPATPSKNLGFGSKAIKLEGGTEGGPQTMANLEGITVAADGVITANHAVHGAITVGRIDIATFANPQGLMQAGNTYFQAGPNSGIMNMSQPGRNGAGDLVGGSLEQSNVDLSQEFSDMITTQRAYQANSRIITVSDTMLEELINLKR